MRSNPPAHPPRSRRQAGLTLVEFMVAMAIGLILVAGIAVLIARQSSSHAELENSSRQIENGRFALTLLQADIQHAGFYGQFSGSLPAPTALSNPCDNSTAAIMDTALSLPMQGYDAPASVPAPLSTCLPDANHVPGTDILVVRRLEADDAPPALTSLVAGQFYVQDTPTAKITGLGPDPTPAAPSLYTLTQKDGVTPAEIRKYIERIYFVSPCNIYATGATTCTAAADGGKPVPTLKRLELTVSGGASAFTTVPLVEGVENMQLDYGIDNVGNGVAATPFVTAPALADWPNVVEIQISLLVRNPRTSTDYTNQKSFSMGLSGTVGPFNDAYRRHAYSLNVRVTNIAARRE